MKVRIAGVVLVVLALAVAVPAVAHAGLLKHFRQALAQRINHYRATHGRHSLRIKIHLREAAQAHSGDMAKYHTLSHSASTGVSWITRIRWWGYRGTYIGEDLAVGSVTAEGRDADVARVAGAQRQPARWALPVGRPRRGPGHVVGRAGVYVTADFGGN